jgi:predicted RNase H-like HicB family nuclease
MASRISLTAIYEPVEEGWIQARVKELPGVITAAPTLDEAKSMLEDAVREYLVAQLEDGETGSPAAQEEHVKVTIGF